MKKLLFIISVLLLICSCARKNIAIENPAKDITLTDEERKVITDVIDVVPKNEDPYDVSNVSNQEKLQLAFALMRKQYSDYDIFVSQKYPMNKANMTASFQKYFGKIEIIMENYKCPYCENGIVYKYSDKTGSFTETSHGHGYYALINHNEIITTQEKDGIYLIEVVRLFAAPDSDFYIDHPTDIYTSEKDAYHKTNVIMDLKDTKYCSYNEYSELTCDLALVAKENHHKFQKYIYEFKYENENLIFKGYKAA